jgi:hypothetical protein
MDAGERADAGPSRPRPRKPSRRKQRKEVNDTENLASIFQDISIAKEKQTVEAEKSKGKRQRGKARGRKTKPADSTFVAQEKNQLSMPIRLHPGKGAELDVLRPDVEPVDTAAGGASLETKVPDLAAPDSGETTENDQHDIRDYVIGMSSVGQSFLGVNLSSGLDSAGGPDGGGPEFEPLVLPRLPRKRKGAYGNPPVVSDDELNEKIRASWNKDRVAKASRKKEREALRRQGLLQVKKEDMLDELFDVRANYPIGGMKLEDLKRELENFCLSLPNLQCVFHCSLDYSNSHSLALPPVSPAARKAIHTIIHKINLKSKSHGKDEARYIIISKPASGQHEWNPRMFDRVASSLKVRFYLNSKPNSKDDAKDVWENVGFGEQTSWNTPAIMKPTTGTVKAKAWMQKMGWTEGQGLGSSENKGIVDPIEVFKRSNRGGLGWDS